MRGAILADDSTLLPDGEVPPPWPARRVTVGGAMLHVRDTPGLTPEAQPAVYVHGLGGSSQNFTDLAGLLADRLDGQAVDLPGFGYSDPSPRYSIPSFASTLIDYLDHSGRGPVHLIGNSLGGSISVRVAALRPDLVRTLTLISPAMPFLDPRRTAQGPVLPLLALPGAERLMAWALTRVTAEEMAEQVLAACFGDTTKVHPQRRAEAMAEIQLRYTVAHYPRAYLGTLRGLVGSFLRAYLPGDNSQWRLAARIEAPTLVIGGLTDKLIDPRVPAQVARIVPDGRLLILPGVGHVAQMEVPRLVGRAIVGLLTEAHQSTSGNV
ncbi:alpha/beta fold hydrolase [Actinoplanes derwentensis]|uniref:Pimeloyl-ACP methyl ester carboxylesterase n=1 Tax=Actinoplanes derwentensis TaxID=113562 RepID=A0A1H2CMN7_9ACTN|nr:alpha/beta hydrolase [Actinoplanes derwentensis]GID86162.1 alpha/beta hydrolase [Actinoplanes derwentensis]SDT71599.1 Pimeloyl-ACP methyl ester carboxylesterase [Actinoplanes derwentensis]